MVSTLTDCDYDYALGLPKCEVDPNGAVTRAAYDAYGRLVKVARSGDDLSAPTIQIVYYDTDVPFRTDATQKIGRQPQPERAQVLQRAGGTDPDPAGGGGTARQCLFDRRRQRRGRVHGDRRPED